MAKEGSGTHGYPPTHPSQDTDKSQRPDNAGAHGAPEGEVEIDTASGLSGDKGVHGVGRPDLPTGTGSGLKIGESEWATDASKDRKNEPGAEEPD